jgi:hypothetical protein
MSDNCLERPTESDWRRFRGAVPPTPRARGMLGVERHPGFLRFWVPPPPGEVGAKYYDSYDADQAHE